MKGRVKVLLLIGVVVIGGWYYAQRTMPEEMQKLTNELNEQIHPSPSTVPFAEMTIPALRSRSYSSQLGELKKYSESATYTTYLTSYDSDGLKINGLLTIPKGKGPHPAIVFVHGYIAPTIYQTTERYGDYVNYLARNGYVVFKIDLRGHDESEGEATGSYYSEGYVVDTLNAYTALQKAEFVDPKRIGLWGHSMAGNVTFRALVAKQDIPAVVIWAGAGYTYSDLREYRISDNSYRPPQASSESSNRRARLREIHGEYDETKEFWRLVNPINYLEGVKTAIQVNHAVDDEVVSVEYGRNLMRVLEGTQIVHELKEYPNGGHNLSGASFTPAMAATVEFFQTHMLE